MLFIRAFFFDEHFVAFTRTSFFVFQQFTGLINTLNRCCSRVSSLNLIILIPKIFFILSLILLLWMVFRDTEGGEEVIYVWTHKKQ